MIYATANIDPYIPTGNLSTTYKHYTTYTNLYSTVKSTLETVCNQVRLYTTSSSTEITHTILVVQSYRKINLRNL